MQWSGTRWVGRVTSSECQRVERRLVREDMKKRHGVERWVVRDVGDELELEMARADRVAMARLARSAITGVEKPWKSAIEPALLKAVAELGAP